MFIEHKSGASGYDDVLYIKAYPLISPKIHDKPPFILQGLNSSVYAMKYPGSTMKAFKPQKFDDMSPLTLTGCDVTLFCLYYTTPVMNIK